MNVDSLLEPHWIYLKPMLWHFLSRYVLHIIDWKAPMFVWSTVILNQSHIVCNTRIWTPPQFLCLFWKRKSDTSLECLATWSSTFFFWKFFWLHVLTSDKFLHANSSCLFLMAEHEINMHWRSYSLLPKFMFLLHPTKLLSDDRTYKGAKMIKHYSRFYSQK